MNSFQGKVIAITGGASGIGLATAKLLHAQGAFLSLADVNNQALVKVKSDLDSLEGNGRVAITTLDVRDSGKVNIWIKSTSSFFGRLNGAANLAGIMPAASQIADMSDEMWDLVMGINCKGLFNCLRAELAVMSEQGSGSIVNASSAAGLRSLAGQAAYSASKSAIISLTKTAAIEAGRSNVRVNAIAPGPIDTPLLSRMEADIGGEVPLSTLPLPRKGSPEEVAKLIMYLLSDDSSYQTGSTVSVDGGYLS